MASLESPDLLGFVAGGGPFPHLSAKLLSDRISSEREPSMGEVTTIGLDLAKHVFQVHGAPSAATAAGRSRRAGEQDRAHRLGGDAPA
jgi:hypothetical protein